MAILFSRLVIKSCRINLGNPALTNVIWKDRWSFFQCANKCSWFSTGIGSKVVQNDGKFLGISYLKDGNDGVVQSDEEYPDWLWQLNKHKQTMEKLDPQSRTYRRLLRKTQRREENERRKMKRF